MIQSTIQRSLILACFVLSVSLFASTQGTPTVTKTSSIAGMVVKEPGSEPLKKVLVQVVAEEQGESYSASTDGDGHFRVDNIVPGRYRIFIERAGFAAVDGDGAKSDAKVLTVQAGQAEEDLLFRMLPTAVINGRITDEDGDPISGVRVFALRKKTGKGGREGAGTVGTNDLGEYRLAGLFPGQYWILAMPPPDYRDYERQQKSQAEDGSTDTRYINTYYPGTSDVAQASAIKLRAGDEMPVDLTLVPARTYRVRGMVTGLAANQKATVELIAKTGDSYRVNANDIGADGQFEVRGVAPGSYVVSASAGTETRSLTAQQEINVVAADVEGVKLAPVASFAISGHFRVDGAANADVTRYVVNLRLAELPEDPGLFMSQDFFGMNASVDRQGNFEWKNLKPGNYIVQVYGADAQSNFFLKSVTLGGRDATTGFSASGPAMVNVLVSAGAGTIEGTVVAKENADTDHGNTGRTTDQTTSGQPNSDQFVPNTLVVAVPEEKFRNIPGRFANGTTDQHGHFVIHGVAPGIYTLYAWQNLEEGTWYDRDFLKSEEGGGTKVKVEENSHQQVELTVSPVVAEWR